MRKPKSLTQRVGVDSGGTFTDFVVIGSGGIEIFKKFSTTGKPAEAILSGIAHLNPSEVIHGSTVATNALLERKGARVALLTTAGFEDVLVIGRQTRRELYNIFVQRPDPLVPDQLRLGVRERVLFDGTIERPVDEKQLAQLIAFLKDKHVESAAVCLLFSFANSRHEEAIGLALNPLGIPVSLSSRILPEFREYERTSTTVVNAYLAPTMSEYLNQLGEALKGSKLRVMQSNGGAVTARVVAESPVRTIVSGPAGGVVGAFHLATLSGYDRIITFDMGGTSTDVALCEGAIGVTHEGEVDGFPVAIPMIDIHTVGAGGGSIAELDAGGALRVGPESAGADPGPICYGRGGRRLTVTDANVLLGRLPPRFFLGGTEPLAVSRIAPAAAELSWTAKWDSVERLAQGIVDVVNNNMEQAIRLISVERGYDPRDFTLVSFGGGGGLHAADLARALGISRVLVPPFPGALSALGLLLADTRKDYSRSLLIPVQGSGPRVRDELQNLHELGLSEMKLEGFAAKEIRHEDFVDLRYKGQSYDLTVPLKRGFAERFHALHERRFGYSDPAKPIELVGVRSTFSGRTPKITFRKHRKTGSIPQPVAISPVWIMGKPRKTAIYDRKALGHGNEVKGPAIIGEYSSTTFVPPNFVCRVDEYLNLVLEP
jgi:N-methylhydantoinase A